MGVCLSYSDEASGYKWTWDYSEAAAPTDFILHNHNDEFEILIFLKGDASFRVEGTTYSPEPWDIIIANPNEMHKMCMNSVSEYERYIINIADSFFVKNDCAMFKDIFQNRTLGSNNLIKADDVIKAIVERFISCVKDGAPPIVMKSVFIEFLYQMCKNAEQPQIHLTTQAHIKEIILYINENISQELALDDIAERFFLNKYHLCHIFRKHTGLSVNRYINYKRLLLARELYAQGMSLTDASEEAGFCNYSSFYKMYRREFGASPRSDLKKK